MVHCFLLEGFMKNISDKQGHLNYFKTIAVKRIEVNFHCNLEQ